jgi:hypothetical protein
MSIYDKALQLTKALYEELERIDYLHKEIHADGDTDIWIRLLAGASLKHLQFSLEYDKEEREQ